MLFALATVGIVDGIRFYSEFKHNCNESPAKLGCQAFVENHPIAPRTIDVKLDYNQGSYSIQAGTFSSEQKANDLLASLQQWGVPARKVTVRDNKRRSLTQIQIGRFPDTKTARDAASQLKTRGVISEFAIGTFFRAN